MNMPNNNEKDKVEDINFMQVGETVACGHCQPDKGFDLPEKYGAKCDCKCHAVEPLQDEVEIEFDKRFEFLRDIYGDNLDEIKTWIRSYGESVRQKTLDEAIDVLIEASKKTLSGEYRKVSMIKAVEDLKDNK